MHCISSGMARCPMLKESTSWAPCLHPTIHLFPGTQYLTSFTNSRMSLSHLSSATMTSPRRHQTCCKLRPQLIHRRPRPTIISRFGCLICITRPLIGSRKELPQEILAANETLASKRELTRILRAKKCDELYLQDGDQVELYVKRDQDRRHKWSLPRTFLSFDKESWTVVLPGAAGRTVKDAIEDVSTAVTAH